MKTKIGKVVVFIFLLLFLVSMSVACFAQKHKSFAEPWDKWDCIQYVNSVSREDANNASAEAKLYFVNKLIAFKKHCDTDSILEIMPIHGTGKALYQYVKPEPTFEYFIIWIDKHR